MNSILVSEAIDNIKRWHNEACERMEVWHRGAFPDCSQKIIRPRYKIIYKVTRNAGTYFARKHTCVYPLAYCILAKEDYRITVIHEVVHGYQWQILPICKAHCDFFHFLMRKVMGVENSRRCHPYSVVKAKQIARILEVIE